MDPRHWLRMAQELQAAGHGAGALAAYRRYLEASPGHAGAWADMGGLLMNMDRLPEALQACERALELDPKLAFGRVNLACTWRKMGRQEEAEALLLEVLAGEPDRTDACLALGECLIRRGDLDGGLACLEKVLAQEPGNLQAFRQAVFVHARRRDHGAQYALMARVAEAVPDSAEVLFELSHLDLKLGVMPKGWDEYESRFRLADQVVSLAGHFAEPLWDGRSFPGKTLMLHCEQGLGDAMMFIRFASLAKARGGQVVVLAPPALVDLLATCPGVDRVVALGDAAPSFDFQLPLMSLPRVFRTRLDSIPADIPYLRVPEQVPNRERLTEVLALSAGRVRIGYVWAGRSEFLNDRNRSMTPQDLAPLGALPGVAWHSFQIPVPEVHPLPGVPLGPLLSTFSDTAYALSAMDLVITVDTALAHAAGALGIPTFLMIPFEPDWRWLTDRVDSPWYPTLRIYQQPQPGDWDSVIRDILRDLSQD